MFASLSKSISENAKNYKSTSVCRTMATRLKKSYVAAGAYGNQYDKYRDALWEIQLRCVEIAGQELDRKYAS